ncbi:hypothetical protein FACS189419_02460 [Planctomycetales bacterium]|nr:hypothetical protein FACS189419_02460 [Planctomycetales bacterium]
MSEENEKTVSQSSPDNIPSGKKSKKKEKPAKKKPVKTAAPRDWNGTICLFFAGLVLLVLIAANLVTLLSSSNFMQTLIFLGTLDVLGLCIVAVPVMFYRKREDINVFNVLLGIASSAMFIGVIVMITEFFRYGFTFKP